MKKYEVDKLMKHAVLKQESANNGPRAKCGRHSEILPPAIYSKAKNTLQE